MIWIKAVEIETKTTVPKGTQLSSSATIENAVVLVSTGIFADESNAALPLLLYGIALYNNLNPVSLRPLAGER